MVYIKGMDPLICRHCIALDDDAKPTRQMLCWLNPAMKEVVKSEVSKLLDVGIIYLIADSKQVSPIQVVPKKSGITVIQNKDEEWCRLILLKIGMCINYKKLNKVMRKDYFPLPFLDQVHKRVAGHEFYCFLNSYSGYYQIKISFEDQRKNYFYLSLQHFYCLKNVIWIK